jgi:hypothetical protein
MKIKPMEKAFIGSFNVRDILRVPKELKVFFRTVLVASVYLSVFHGLH